MKRTITFLAIALMVLLTGCKKINEQFENINNRLDQIEGSSLTTIDQQIKAINSSLDDLKAVDSALQTLIDNLEAEAAKLQQQLDDNAAADAATKKALEGEIANVKALIEALQAKDAELEKKIADLQTYVDGEIAATEEWAKATFATLAQYEGVQAEIAAIKALIEQYKTDITAAYTKAIEDAISASETSMKTWVNELLAEGYYDIAAIDAKLSALETRLAGADAELKKQIEDQKAALEQARKDLTAAYEKAIADAIETNNGVLNKAIADAIQDALDKVDTKLAVIDNAIAAIQKDIAAIKSSIAAIEDQIKAINSSLDDLKAVDSALQTLIDNLEAEAAKLQQQLDDNAAADAATKKALEGEIANVKALIEALQAKDAELEKKIADLQTYVDGEIAATEEWAKATFATLAQYEGVQAEIAAIKALIEQYKTDITAAYTKAIEDAISASETSMKTWVNELLAEGYYDIAAIDAKLSALETRLAGADAELKKQIEDQKAALEQARKDLTAAYEKAIADAIETNNGVITAAIAKAVKTAQNALQAQIDDIYDEIEDINDRLTKLENNFANRIQSLTYIPKYSDGKIKLDYASRTTSATFRISPASLAELIRTENVKAFARYTDDPVTRAVNSEFSMIVTSVTTGNNGIFEVALAESNENPFADNFWNGDVEAVVYIQITDNNGNDVVSEAIPMIAHGYVSNGNSIDGFGDGESHSGIVK